MKLAIRCTHCGDEEVIKDPEEVARIMEELQEVGGGWYERRDAIEAINKFVPCPECTS